MNCPVDPVTRRKSTLLCLIVGITCCALIFPAAAIADQSVTLAWDPSPDTNVISYNVYYGPGTGNYTNLLSLGNTTNATVTGLLEGGTYFFVATAVDAIGLESDPSNEISYSVPVGTNRPPTIDPIGPLVISENASMQVVTVTGITSGVGDGPQPLTVTSSSSDTSIIPDPAVSYSSPGSTATLSFAPIANASGGADITVTVSDSILTAQAVFHVTVNQVIPPVTFPAPRGTFSGLFYEPDEVRQSSAGFFAVTVTSSGAYSGRVQLGGKKYSFHGVFNSQGAATNTILRNLDTPLQLELHLGAGPLTNQISGAVNSGSWVADLSGERALYNAATNPSPQAGTYAMRVPGLAGIPPLMGDGFATLKVSPSGVAKLAGALPDGVKFSVGAAISKSSQIPIYVSLYRGKGALVSWLAVTNLGAGTVSGLGSWTKSADSLVHFYSEGVTNDCFILGSTFHPPNSLGHPLINFTNGIISFAGGNLGLGFSNQIAISSLGKVTNLSSNKLALTFSSGSGMFTGNVTDPLSGKTMPFKGVLVQDANTGYGYLLGTNRSSAVLISQP